jgi:glycogen synthase
VSRAPRVLMTADAVGGVWRYALDLARDLAAGDGEVLLATMGPRPDPDQLAEAEGIDGLTLVASDFDLEWMDDPWDDVDRAGAWLVEVERDWRPDVVHLNGYCHGDLPWSAPVVIAGHSCVASWWQAVHGRPVPPRWDAYRRRVRSGLAAADLVVAPTRAMLDDLGRHHGPLPRVRVIHNGVDTRRYRALPKESVALCVGRLWDESKNVAALAPIASDLPWPVRLVGETAHPSGRSTAGLQGVTCLGPRPHADVVEQMARAAVYVHPARYEPFGLSVLEAALSGCALVLADIASLREVWGDAALYAPPDDRAALREALTRAMTDAALRGRLVERSLARALRLTAPAMGEGYRRLYDDARTIGVRA